MDKGGVATAVLSLPHPVGIWLADREAAKRMACEWNEYIAGMARDHPGRFGVFAALPILDIEGSLIESGNAHRLFPRLMANRPSHGKAQEN